MANKVRCKNCKEYFLREDGFQVGLGWVHNDCREEFTVASFQAPKHKKKKSFTPPKYAESDYTGELRETILTRDEFRCRLCGESNNLAVHHINYRSDYRNKPYENAEWNLISLCNQTCHLRIVHGNKKYYQPILLGMNWIYYTEGRLLSVPQFEKEFEDLLNA